MANRKHVHRAKTVRTVGWSHCVTPTECAANPSRGIAHGNRTDIATCSCGAIRHSEYNGGRINHGPWSDPEES